MAGYGYGGGPSMEYESPNSPTNQLNARNAATIAAANQAAGYQAYNPASFQDQAKAQIARVANIMAQQRPATQTRAPTASVRVGSSGGSSGGSSRRSGGGGGGGGAAALPTLNQSQLDWAASVLKGGAPTGATATTLDLPDYAGMPMRAFDPSMWQNALGQLNQGEQTDLGTAATATQNMLNFLNTNYTNAFNNPNLQYATAGNAPGTTQLGMQRMLQSQGVNPGVAAGTYNQAQNADQAFGSLWRTLAGNEDIAQRGRLANAQLYGNQAADAIRAAAQGGRLGLNIGQAQAQSAWQQAADQRAYEDYQMQQQIAQQEALQNWQRANQVTDTNQAATNSYRNAEMQALLGLLPELIKSPGLTPPSLASLGLG